MDRVIFSNRMTGKTLAYVLALGVFSGVFIFYLSESKNNLTLIALVIGATALFPLLYWLVIRFFARNLIGELILRNDKLQVEMVHVLGKGKKFEIPIPPAADWSWYSQKESSSSTQRVGVIKIKSGGKTYEMTLDGAKVVDEVELRKLAPNLVDEMIASKVMIHKPA